MNVYIPQRFTLRILAAGTTAVRRELESRLGSGTVSYVGANPDPEYQGVQVLGGTPESAGLAWDIATAELAKYDQAIKAQNQREQYARDDAKLDEPWLLWECRPKPTGRHEAPWETLTGPAAWLEGVEYRRKEEAQ